MGGYLIKTEIKIVLHISHFLIPSFVKNFGQRGHTVRQCYWKQQSESCDC